MSSKIKKTNKQNDIMADNKRKLSKPAKAAIVIGLVIVILVGVVMHLHSSHILMQSSIRRSSTHIRTSLALLRVYML